MNKIQTYHNIYFLGIGGIGMSALARYFKLIGKNVAGYDKTKSPLTDTLISEGIDIHFEDFGPVIPAGFREKSDTLVIYTPAVPKNMGELLHFQHNGFTLLKRAEVLGLITRDSKGLCVAGTHGKTTTSTLLAHILTQSNLKCTAFLGGISANFNSNFIFSESSPYSVIEADEFDRSFLQLNPFGSIVTSIDADHLDVYGNSEDFLKGFQAYAERIDESGILILKKGIELKTKAKKTYYSVNEDADFTGKNLRMEKESFFMDVAFSSEKWNDVELGLPGIHNAENALACIAFCCFLGLNQTEIRNGLKTFKGVKRRFEFHVRTEQIVYIDDYAHHPTEIKALVDSIRLLYPTKKITGIFQPHLFSRTRDFMDEFAKELSKLDELILLPIYPAREEPISGVNSESLLEKCTNTH
jgi:UDP-N-acetylmuramate--alanine ligase